VAKWRKRLGPRQAPRVGIAWAGSAVHTNNRQRSIALERIAQILPVPGIEFVSIQKERSEADAGILAKLGILPLGEELDDFADTAAVISLLDLVVSVDTSVVHLAGALGHPVWILVPFAPDFRWLLAREDSPWYPTVRLFRQSQLGDWDGVLDRVRREVMSLADAR
jgi:hypothetical protein